MATGTIKSNTLKYVGSGTTVNISNIKASEFVVIANYNDTFVYSITIPSAELASGSRRFFNGYGYQSNTNLVSVSATSTAITLNEFTRDGNNVTSSATIAVYYR